MRPITKLTEPIIIDKTGIVDNYSTRIMEFMLFYHFLFWKWIHMKMLAFTGHETTWTYETDNFKETININ